MTTAPAAEPATAPDGSPPPVPQRRAVDQVASLLGDVIASGLDEGYVLAARRKKLAAEAATAAADLGAVPERRAPHAPEPADGRQLSRPRLAAAVVCLVIAGLLLATAASQTRRRAPDTAAARDELVQEVLDRRQVLARLQADSRALADEIAAVRATQRQDSRRGEQLAASLGTLQASAGTAAVQGPGLRVTLDDAADTDGGDGSRGGTFGEGRLSDRDLQEVVNGLWAAGAEAIAIDGIRLTSRSAIRAAGEAILVDFRPASPPYVIEAIGNPRTLPETFAKSPVAERLEVWRASFGISYETARVQTLRLAAAQFKPLAAATPAAAP